jgi:P27 family predicted phage terminase small subunit
MRGRKPKPIEFKEDDGNPGRRPLPEKIIEASGLPAEPPALLGPAGAEVYRKLVQRLGRALDEVDIFALTAMCIQWDRAAEAAGTIDQQGHYARGSMGQLVEHPALKTERAAHKAFVAFAAEYGATPVARARVAAAQSARAQAQELAEIVEADPVEIGEDEEIDPDVL